MIHRIYTILKKMLLLVFLIIYSSISAASDIYSEKLFFLLPSFNDLKVINPTLNEIRVTSKLQCAKMCSQVARCKGFFFSANDNTCAAYDDKVHLMTYVEYPGMRRYGRTQNCYDVKSKHNTNGVYTLTAPEVYNVPVYCDMTTDNGGWLVIQRRVDGSVDFYRTWKEYMDGFGDLNGEFWLGNEKIHQITTQMSYELRVDLEDFEGNKRYAVYSNFSMDSKETFYTLYVGSYTGNAGNSLAGSFGIKKQPIPFSTKDVDNDFIWNHCAQRFHGGWWYTNCHTANLNGVYTSVGYEKCHSRNVVWVGFRGFYYSLKTTEMKIRPTFN